MVLYFQLEMGKKVLRVECRVGNKIGFYCTCRCRVGKCWGSSGLPPETPRGYLGKPGSVAFLLGTLFMYACFLGRKIKHPKAVYIWWNDFTARRK